MTLRTQALLVALAVGSIATPLSSVVSARDTHSAMSDAGPRTVVGVWRTVVTPRNCQTGAPFPSLHGVFTFNEGGTMSEYGIGPGSSPALRSPGHGVWRREPGWQDHSFTFMFYRYDASGVLLGSQKITAVLRLDESGTRIDTISTIAMLDIDGNVIGGGCATAVGTPFE